MSKTLIINSSNYVTGSGNKFVYRFPNTVSFHAGSSIGVSSISMYNSTFNIESSRGNNVINIIWLGTTYILTFEDGYYSVSDINFRIQQFCILNNLYVTSNYSRYTSCRGSVPNIKIERISDDVKDVIFDIIGNKYNSKLFDKLFTDDQRIIANLIKTLRIPDINMDVFNKKYQHEYEILLGQVNSGNTNEKVKLQLKKYILRGISENLIPRNQGLNQLLNLS